MALAVAMNEWLTVTTSSPGPTPRATSARCSAVVQLDTAQACGAPTAAANSRSKAATSGPCVTQPERIARRAASASRSSSQGRATGISERPLTAVFGTPPGVPSATLLRRHPVPRDLALEQLLGRGGLRAIPLEEPRQPLLQRHARTVIEERLRVAHVGVQAQHITRARLMPLHRHRTPDRPPHLQGEGVDRELGTEPEVDRLPDRVGMLPREDDPARAVGDEREVAGLRAITEDEQRKAGQPAQHELRNHLAAVALVVRTGTV